MKRVLLILVGMIFSISLQSQITYTTATTPVTCFGGNDGTATITSITGFGFYNSSTKGLLISEIYADPTGIDSSHEFVELIATRFIDFAATPYTVIVSNNNVATTNGWIAGTNKTYAFLINSGTVTAGQIVYVGGSTMIPQTNRIRFINVAMTAGDGAIGTANPAGVFGNGGVNCDGVAVFNTTVGSITSSTVPIDAVFYGSGTGTAVVGGGTQGYELPINDMYAGGKLQTTSTLAPDIGVGFLLKATFGIYNVSSNTFTTPRTWATTANANFTNLTTSLLIDRLYNVNWSNACTSVYNPNLTAGNYTFTITDQFSTLVSGNVTVANGVMIQLNAATSDSFACVGDLIDLSAQNADVYSWNNGDLTANSQITVTGDTLAIVTGTDTILGCTWSDSVFIDVNAYPVISFSMANDTSCNDGGIVPLSATPAGGTFAGSGVTGSSLDPSALSGMNSITYTYADANGCADIDTVDYLVLDCTGIENLDENLASIYPNPATDYLFLVSDINNLRFSLTDLQGKQVKEGILNSEKMIPILDLPTGLYIITMYGDNSVKRMKFTKN